MNITCKLWIGPEESNSKSAKLSVRANSSFSIPVVVSISSMTTSVGRMFKVAVLMISLNTCYAFEGIMMLTRSKCEIICKQLRRPHRKVIAPEKRRFAKKFPSRAILVNSCADSVISVNCFVNSSSCIILGIFTITVVSYLMFYRLLAEKKYLGSNTVTFSLSRYIPADI